MITGELKNKIDKIWDDMYSYGIANPLTVIEQLTYLFFIRSLDEVETANERQDSLLGITTDRIFPENKQHLRWSKFKGRRAGKSLLLRDEVFPFIKKLQTPRRVRMHVIAMPTFVTQCANN